MPEQSWRINIRRLPWVRELKRDRGQCEGIRWNRVPMKAVWHPKTHKRQPVEMLEPYRCKNQAQWSYRFLAGSYRYREQTKRFCSSHLYASGVEGTREEYARVEKWFKKHGVQ